MIYRSVLYFVAKAMVEMIGEKAAKAVLRQAGLEGLLGLEEPPSPSDLASLEFSRRLRLVNIKFFGKAHAVFLRRAGLFTAKSIKLPEKVELLLRDKAAVKDWRTLLLSLVDGFLAPIKSKAEVERIGDKYAVKIYDCPECWGMRSEEPQCHFIASFISGIIERLTGKRVNVKEEKCRASGHEFCEFTITASGVNLYSQITR